MGLIGGPLAFAGGTAVLFGLFEQPSAPFVALLTPPEILWEASLALYLTFKAFRPSPILQEHARPAPRPGGRPGVTQATPTTTLALAWPCSR